MKSMWWKILSVLLIIYSLVAGLLFPLKAGITSISPQSIKTGATQTLHIKGYNTAFADAGNNSFWLKLNDTLAIKCGDAVITDNNNIDIQVTVPQLLPKGIVENKTFASLVVANRIDGAFPYPEAVIITQDSTTNRSVGQWNQLPKDLEKSEYTSFPFRNILMETIRNTFYHVPMWFAMIFMFLVAAYYSWRALRTGNSEYDHKALAYTDMGLVFGCLGIVTGALWAKHTWGAYWSFDVKQNMSAVCLLIYCAYFVLRESFEDQEKRARISAVYNIFAFAAVIPLLWVIPRLVDSLHPGNGGNPAFGTQDLDSTMRMIFYPANIGWILFGCWAAQLSYRLAAIKEKMMDV
jgi:heme exporter protein C